MSGLQKNVPQRPVLLIWGGCNNTSTERNDNSIYEDINSWHIILLSTTFFVNYRMEETTFADWVRMRPGMYMGNRGLKGILNLFNGVALDCIKLSGDNDIDFELTIFEKEFSLKIIGTKINPIKNAIESEDITAAFNINILKAVCNKFEIFPTETAIQLAFRLDEKVFTTTKVDYTALYGVLLQTAILNPTIAIILTDRSSGHINQNHLHFPDGLKYLLDSVVNNEINNDVAFQFAHKEIIQQHEYSFAIAYREQWHSRPHILSFANSLNTEGGGSHVDGIINGLISASRKYLGTFNLKNTKIGRTDILDRLVLVCHVKGDIQYYGSTKDVVEDKLVKATFKKIAAKIFYDYLNKDPEAAMKYLRRGKLETILSTLSQNT